MQYFKNLQTIFLYEQLFETLRTLNIALKIGIRLGMYVCMWMSETDWNATSHKFGSYFAAKLLKYLPELKVLTNFCRGNSLCSKIHTYFGPILQSSY